jgi:hypothetical protein
VPLTPHIKNQPRQTTAVSGGKPDVHLITPHLVGKNIGTRQKNIEQHGKYHEGLLVE